jgi:amino acid transporter
MSLIPLLAWVGLGADGLSSSAYGPEEAYRALGQHAYLALFLGLATAITVFTISFAYSRIIEHFPHGGGGYIVATKMLGKEAGVVSGSALLVDYVLTVTVSIASCVDAVFSYLPPYMHAYKVLTACLLLLALVIMNIRGVKESITILAPIFLVFIVTHALMLFDGVLTHTDQFAPMITDMRQGLSRDVISIGWFGILAIALRAYSLGGGTYTGIEAVSNGLQIMREPKVQNGKRTMLYMALSLAFTAGLLFLCYALIGVKPVAGRTLNAVLADNLFADWKFGGTIAFVTIFSEGALLLVAVQAGFVDGPRVMANMALDSWFPRRFAAVSQRLTMQNGIVLMGIAAFILLLYTHGSVSALIIMYSINVFVTFSFSQLGMSRFFIQRRHDMPQWKRKLSVHVVGLALCVTILAVIVFEKFTEGGWVTVVITSVVIGLCYWIHGHYDKVKEGVRELDEMLMDLPLSGPIYTGEPKRNDQTAIQLVSGYNGFGVHTFMTIARTFPNLYKNIVFISIAVVDSGSFHGSDSIDELESKTQADMERYVELARKLGFAAEWRTDVATDVVEGAVKVCKEVVKDYPRSTVFAGQITFRLEKGYHRLLHNETSYSIQRLLQWAGITTVILPIRIKN